MRLQIREFFVSDRCLAGFTTMFIIPYILMFFGILPELEIVNTINALSTICLFVVLSIAFSTKVVSVKRIQIYFILLCWCVLIVLVNGVFLGDSRYLIYNANALSVLSLTYVIYVIDNNLLTYQSIRKALFVVVLVAIFSCVINLVVNYNTILDISNIIKPYDARFTGLFLGRNQFGGFLFLSLVSCVFLRDIFKVNANIYFFIFISINLILTFSRSPILATVIFLFISNFELKSKKCWIAVLFFIIMLMTIYFSSPIGEIIDKFLIRKEVGSAGRIERWNNLLSIVLENPLMLFGISPAGFKEVMLINGFEFAQIDNAYIEVLVSYGLLGLVIYLSLFVYNIYLISNNRIDYKIKKDIFAFTCAFFFYNFLEAMILFEAGVIQWVATLLFVVVSRYCIKEGCNYK